MSAVYEIDTPAQGVLERTFHIVRAATRFTVSFTSWRGETVRVGTLSLSGIADKNFLMAHVSDSEQNRLLFNGKTWIEWLKEVSEASSADDSYDTTEAAGWLKDYSLPEAASLQETYTYPAAIEVPAAQFEPDNLEAVMPGHTAVSFYLPESKNPKSGASDGEQEYTMTVGIDGLTAPFVFTLPNLKALFRNTHVLVNLILNRNMEMSVDVIPFTSVEVSPEYGLEREDFTGYIIGKDKDGHKCWYAGADGPYYLGPASNPESFVTINNVEYLLVYSDYERTAPNLNHFYEKETRRLYRITPEAITGYIGVMEPGKPWLAFYLNNIKERVWLDDSNLRLNCCRTLNEWDRLEYNIVVYNYEGYDHDSINPKFWFDVLGNRYPWSQGDTEAKRKEKLGEWVQYLE